MSTSMSTKASKSNYPSKVVWPFRSKWTVDHLTRQSEAFVQMQTKTPCTDYIETKGLIYFARMLDKIRLKAAGKLPPAYFTGVEDQTHFDARCTRFLGVNYDELVQRTLQGGSDEEILEWCFAMVGGPATKKFPSGMRFFANAAGEMMPAKSLLSRRTRQVSAIGKTFKRGWTCTTQRKEDGQLSPEAGTPFASDHE